MVNITEKIKEYGLPAPNSSCFLFGSGSGNMISDCNIRIEDEMKRTQSELIQS